MTNPPDVEFLGADLDDDIDEELPHRPARPRPWMLRIAVGAAVLVVAVGAVRAAIDRTHRPAARATTVVTQSPSRPNVPTREPRRDIVEAVIPKLQVPPTCPVARDGQAACSTTHALPKAFLAAVRAQFPRTETISTVTQVARANGAAEVHGLWSRQFTGVFGVTTVHVVVTAGVEPDLITTNSFDDGIWVRSATWYRAGSLAVQVFASAPSGHETSFTRLGRLSRDPRLLPIT
jgi:hypothetical protein